MPMFIFYPSGFVLRVNKQFRKELMFNYSDLNKSTEYLTKLQVRREELTIPFSSEPSTQTPTPEFWPVSTESLWLVPRFTYALFIISPVFTLFVLSLVDYYRLSITHHHSIYLLIVKSIIYRRLYFTSNNPPRKYLVDIEWKGTIYPPSTSRKGRTFLLCACSLLR